MQRRLKIKLKKLLIITICFLIVGVLISFYDYFLLSSDLTGGYGQNFSFWKSLLFNLAGSFAGSVLGGSFLVFYVNEKFRERSYGFTILTVIACFVIVVSLITVLLGMVAALGQTGKPLTDPETARLLKNNIINPFQLKSVIVWGIVVALTQLFLSIDFKFGNGLLWQFIKGKYHRPREEKRIFMFLDINSSTATAEKLGNEKYHYLLKDFFSDITNPILDNRGDIYQYAGDEVIISWPADHGIEKNYCIQCYFDIKKKIGMNKQKYLDKYGFIPGFKVGIHLGKIIAGEVGIIKREITFSGDVLNTTSRIRGMCNELSVDVLMSDELTRELPDANKFITRSMGASRLRGKEKDIELMTMELAIA